MEKKDWFSTEQTQRKSTLEFISINIISFSMWSFVMLTFFFWSWIQLIFTFMNPIWKQTPELTTKNVTYYLAYSLIPIWSPKTSKTKFSWYSQIELWIISSNRWLCPFSIVLWSQQSSISDSKANIIYLLPPVARFNLLPIGTNISSTTQLHAQSVPTSILSTTPTTISINNSSLRTQHPTPTTDTSSVTWQSIAYLIDSCEFWLKTCQKLREVNCLEVSNLVSLFWESYLKVCHFRNSRLIHQKVKEKPHFFSFINIPNFVSNGIRQISRKEKDNFMVLTRPHDWNKILIVFRVQIFFVVCQQRWWLSKKLSCNWSEELISWRNVKIK